MDTGRDLLQAAWVCWDENYASKEAYSEESIAGARERQLQGQSSSSSLLLDSMLYSD